MISRISFANSNKICLPKNQFKGISFRRLTTNSSDFIHVNEKNYSQEIQNFQGKIILDCYADWCPPCKALKPKLIEAVTKTNGAIKLALLNVEESPEISSSLNISSIPIVFAFSNGKIVDSFTGNIGQRELDKFINSLLK